MTLPLRSSDPFRFDVLSLLPETFGGFLSTGLIGKAMVGGLLEVVLHDWRVHADDRHGTVDDAPFGGGAGMVLKMAPLLAGLKEAKSAAPESPVVLLTPAGRPLRQATAEGWAKGSGVILICGRYEGFDARIEQHVDEQVSLGDYVLNGGEVAAMAIIEAVGRLRGGVIGNAASLHSESHRGGLLEYPQYTRPRDFHGQEVPDVLLSGDHARIAAWRRQQSLERTRRLRPDLLVGLDDEVEAAD